MLFTPEMEDVLISVGGKVKRHFKQLKADYDHLDSFEQIGLAESKEVYHLLDEMKAIHVGNKKTAVFQLVLALLQFKFMEDKDQRVADHAFREFRSWLEKLQLHKDRKLWWSYVENEPKL